MAPGRLVSAKCLVADFTSFTTGSSSPINFIQATFVTQGANSIYARCASTSSHVYTFVKSQATLHWTHKELACLQPSATVLPARTN